MDDPDWQARLKAIGIRQRAFAAALDRDASRLSVALRSDLSGPGQGDLRGLIRLLEIATPEQRERWLAVCAGGGGAAR